jgi:hypothetical protein
MLGAVHKASCASVIEAAQTRSLRVHVRRAPAHAVASFYYYSFTSFTSFTSFSMYTDRLAAVHAVGAVSEHPLLPQ